MGIWTTVGKLNVARANATATLLPNGQVLVVGGQDGTGNALASAETFQVTAAGGTWSLTGSLMMARSRHTATALPNGQVLVAGGVDSHGNALNSAELYDPTSGTWASTGTMPVARDNATATLLPNGHVLVAGGQDSKGVALASAELFDPTSGTWTSTASLRTPRSLHTATALSNGQVLLAGGVNGSTVLASAELFDPTSGTWTTVGNLNVATESASATMLQNGQVLLVGGQGSTGQSLSAVEVYDPASQTWTSTENLATARQHHTATLLQNGQVLVAGGVDDTPHFLSSAEVFSLAPVLQVPDTITVDATGPQGATVTFTATATDPNTNPPGSLPVTCNPSSGSTFPIGTTTVTCSASTPAPAHNPSVSSFQVIVKGAAAQISDLITLVNSFNLSPQGIQTSFESQLQAVQADLAANNTAQACSDLTSFLNHVKAQSGKQLTVAQAKQLLAAATQIQAVLAC